MKLRIENNSVRLRLSKTDIDELKKNGSVEGVTPMLKNSFKYSLVIDSNESDISLAYESGKIQISTSGKIIDDWSNSDKEGIYNTDQSITKISIEKDYKCLHRGSSELDKFPNPKEK